MSSKYETRLLIKKENNDSKIFKKIQAVRASKNRISSMKKLKI